MRRLSKGVMYSALAVTLGLTWLETMANNNNDLENKEEIHALELSVIKVKNVDCYGGKNGAIELNINGGVGPYLVRLNDLEFNEGGVLENLDAGLHKLELVDAKGNREITEVRITEPSPVISEVAEIAQPKCKGSNDGAVALHSIGGMAPYSYYWDSSTESSEAVNFDLAPGVHEVVTRDANGCTSSLKVEFTEPEEMDVKIASIKTADHTFSLDGSVELEVSGGTEPYKFQWADQKKASPALRRLMPSGKYQVTASDANACESKIEITIPETTSIFSTSLIRKKNVSKKERLSNESLLDVCYNSAMAFHIMGDMHSANEWIAKAKRVIDERLSAKSQVSVNLVNLILLYKNNYKLPAY